ncbi:MAG: hypothetical protein SFY80_07440 [Verrucomicrobiota bacterium]|nr:hypothetical protein [Verrucomicrobiota bacterium]
MHEDRRTHIIAQIDRHLLDIATVTERKGSPKPLICTKDRRSYDRRCKQYLDDISAFRTLATLATKAIAPATTVARMDTARALAVDWMER